MQPFPAAKKASGESPARFARLSAGSGTRQKKLRNYRYDMNGNQAIQIIGKSRLNTDYMRSNLAKHVYGKRDTTAAAYSDLYYEYNNHDDRIYKKVQNSNGSSASSYYLRDASGKELAEWDMSNDSWIHYAYGRDRVAELEGNNGIRYVNYDHLGSVRAVYNVVSSCSGAPEYRLSSLSDYFAFGKTLRSFNGNKYGYQGSEKNEELGASDYYTHFRGLDVDVARWKQVDPLADKFPWQTPYNSMDNNPVNNIDPLGDGTQSTHTDKNGRVVAVYNDGDNGVYKHDDLDGWDKKSTLQKDGKGTTKMGETKYWDEFKNPSDGSPSGQIVFGTNWNGPINILNKEATSKYNLKEIADKSKNNQPYDIKTNQTLAPYGVYTGRLLDGKYATARSAGNYLAGVNGRTGTLFGTHISQEKYMMLAGALQQKIFTKSVAASIYLGTITTEIWPWKAPYYGEEPYSGRAIIDGWNSLDK